MTPPIGSPTADSLAGRSAGAITDAISKVHISLVRVPLDAATNDAKVLTGRQKPLTEIALLVAEISTEAGREGIGFSYAKRAGGPAMFAHAREVAGELVGEDPNDIARLWEKLAWAGASMGRTGLSTQAIAAFDIALWDLKAKRADLALAKLLGAQRESVRCYNTSGGYLSMSAERVLENVDLSRSRGIGGIKIKVGQPDVREDLRRVESVRERLGDDFPMMVDANQQWDRATARRTGRALEQFGLTWIEEPLDCQDVAGHARLTAVLDTPIATGEMLTSVDEHWNFMRHDASDFVQPDAPRVGGITPFLRIAALSEHRKLALAPHFAMEIHLHLAAAHSGTTWIEHFEWLEPAFNERLEVRGGRMIVPNRPGLGLSLSEQARSWTGAETTVAEPA